MHSYFYNNTKILQMIKVLFHYLCLCKQKRMYIKKITGIHRKLSEVFNSTFHIKWDLTQVLTHLGSFYTSFRIFWALGQSQKIGCWHSWADTCTQKLILSLQFHILHQIRPYSSVKAIQRLRVFWALWQFGEIGHKYTKLWTGICRKRS